MEPSTSLFMDSLEKWLIALRSNDFASARRHATNLARMGEMLAIHPDFVRCFKQSYPDMDSREALACISSFFLCATKGRASVVGRN